VTHWGRECRYRRAGVEDAWRLYFEPVSTVSLSDLRREDLSLFPPKWTPANLDAIRVNKDQGEWSGLSGLFLLKRDEDVAVLDFYTELDDIAPWLAHDHPLAAADPEPELGRLYRRHLRLVPRLAAEVDRLAATLLERRPMLAMHYRTQGLPKITESANKQGLGPDIFIAEAERYLAAHADAGIYLTTDFAPAVAYFGERFGERLVTRDVTRVQRVEELSVEIHQQHDGVVLGDEVVLDSFLAARCDAFIGDGASGVSQMVSRLKDWPPGSVTLFRPGPAALAGRLRRHSDPSPWWNPSE
jgi:protein O-GlcNAc transferase